MFLKHIKKCSFYHTDLKLHGSMLHEHTLRCIKLCVNIIEMYCVVETLMMQYYFVSPCILKACVCTVFDERIFCGKRTVKCKSVTLNASGNKFVYVVCFISYKSFFFTLIKCCLFPLLNSTPYSKAFKSCI